jgi:hypothetical protein
MKSWQKPILEVDRCLEILSECGYLPKGPCGAVDLTKIPDGMNATETERFLREHGAELSGLSCNGTVE